MSTTHTLQHDYAAWTPIERRDAIQQGLENLVPIVVAAYEAKDWEHFGFATWKEYGQAALGGYQLGPEARKETVLALSKQKLSQRAIAAVVGTSKETVRRDIAEAATNVPPEVTGLDGKTYPAKPKPPEVESEPEIADVEVVVPPLIILGKSKPLVIEVKSPTVPGLGDGVIEDAEVIEPDEVILPATPQMKVVGMDLDALISREIGKAFPPKESVPLMFVAELIADIRAAGTVSDEQADEIATTAAENMTQLGLAFDRVQFMAAAGVQELVGSVA